MRSASLFLLLALTSQAADITLEAGLAKADITPTTFGPMYGYANRKCGPANGVHDRLFAKALVLRTGDSSLAIVTLDLGSLVSDNLRRDVADKLKIPVLLLSVSHDHSAPAFQGYSAEPGAPISDYQKELEGKIFTAVEQAGKSMFPARLGIGRGSVQLGYNRLLLRDDGRARAVFDNLDRIPYGPLDPEFTLLRVEDAAGATRAILVHYAVHSVVLGPTNCKYSADYPGVLQARVESEIPGAQCMFVQGGAGDINPLFQGRTGNEEADFATTQKMGLLLAAEVLKSAKSIHPISPIQYPIQSTSNLLHFADRWDKSKSLEVGITTVLINREIAIAASPGELMHKLQIAWKTRAAVPYPLFYGYTYSSGGGWPGYVPDLKSAALGGYGADVTTRIEIGAGETLIERHLINLYQMLGMWHDQPGKP
jgi:neutral ceramidase